MKRLLCPDEVIFLKAPVRFVYKNLADLAFPVVTSIAYLQGSAYAVFLRK